VTGGENLKKRDDMGDVDLHGDNTKVFLKGIKWENVDIIYLTLDSEK
jgi:hypothetical protein